MRPDYGSLVDDLMVSSATAIIRLMFRIGKDGLTKTNWLSTISITIGTIMLGVLAGFIAEKSNWDVLHNYHDLFVSLCTLYGKIILDKGEEWINQKKIVIKIPGTEDEVNPNASGRPAE